MFGHHDDLWYGRKWYNEEGRSDTHDVCGDYPAVFSFDVAEIMDDRYQNPENEIRKRVALEAYERGEVLIACAHLNNPLTGGDSWDNSSNEVVKEILKEGSPTHLKFCLLYTSPDGKYADFIFKGSSNPADKTDIDLKKYYRKIPVGESRWIRNYSLGTITFIDSDGNESTAVLENPGTYTLFQGGGYTNTVTLPNNAFSFQINGVDEWTYIYTD